MEIIEIKSPVTGIFVTHGEYLDGTFKENPAKIGDHIKTDTIVCIVEAMEVPIPITSDTAGIIIEILTTNGQEVEYNQTLFRLERDWEWNYDLGEPELNHT